MLHASFTLARYLIGMFEGPIKAVRPADPADSSMLRQLRWTDLVARLAATRELRAIPVETAPEQAASFAALHHELAPEGDRPVNRDALSHGKFARLSASDTADTSADRDRETP